MTVVYGSGSSRRAVLTCVLALALACGFGCESESGGGVGTPCVEHADCASEACVNSVCAAADADDDGDGVYNRAEARLGTNPALADSDEDGRTDLVEIMDTLAPRDSDGDGIIDALESAIADADGDCLPDQADAENDTISGPAATFLEDVCRRGVCGTEEAAAYVTVVCEDGALRCRVEGFGAPYFAEEIDEQGCGDELDNDCDGLTDEGSPDTDGDLLYDCEDPDDDDDGLDDEDDCLPTDAGCLDDCSDGDDNGIPDCAQDCVQPYAEHCDDGVACTVDSCQEGVGCIHTPRHQECNDDNPCTEDVCEPSCPDDWQEADGECSGCYHVPDPEGTCTDNDPCTVNDYCQAGECEPGEYECDCHTNADCADFEDGDLCNGTLECDLENIPYKCVVIPRTVVVCSTINDTVCRASQCNPDDGYCYLTPINEGGSCDDGSPCSGTVAEPDHCEAGECVAGALVCECLFDEDCHTPDMNLCEEDPFCDVADGFRCRDRAAEVVCDADPDPTDCRAPQCVPATGLCENLPVSAGTPCHDDWYCTEGDTCDGEGECVSGELANCDDGFDCTVDSCREEMEGCVNEPDDDACDDGDACTSDACSTERGCVHTALTGTPCDDEDDCTDDDQCQEGVCGGTEICECRSHEDCEALDDDLCDGVLMCDFEPTRFPYSCIVDPDSVPEPCPTDEDTECRQSLCVPETGLCAMQNVNEDGTCDDHDECTPSSTCEAGVCHGTGTLDCADDFDCTTDTCEPDSGCVYTPDHAACPDDGDPCTASVCDVDAGCGHEPGVCSCQALVFDGSGLQRVSAADDDALEVQGGFTVELWLSPAVEGPETGGQPLVAKMTSDTVGDWALLMRGTEVVFRLYRDGDLPLEIAADVLAVGTWDHIAAVVDPVGGQIRLHSFGTQVAQAALTGTPARTDAALWVGPVPTAPTPELAATVDDVRIWQIARQAADISAGYGQALYGDEADLAAYWSFDDVSGGTPDGAADGSAGGHDLSFAEGAPAPAVITTTILSGCESTP